MRDMTQFIASLAGSYLFVTGLGFLISTRFYARMVAGNASADPILLNLSGAVHFLVGLLVVLRHFHWDGLTEALVTLVGLAAVLKGLSLIVVPERALKAPQTSARMLRFSGIAFVLIGAYLGTSAAIDLP